MRTVDEQSVFLVKRLSGSFCDLQVSEKSG